MILVFDLSAARILSAYTTAANRILLCHIIFFITPQSVAIGCATL